MNSKIVFILTLFLLLFSTVSAQITEQDLINVLEDPQQLQYMKAPLNLVLDNSPEIVIDKIVNDGVVHIKVQNSDIAMLIEDGHIEQIASGVPENPSTVVYTEYDTVLNVANSKNPAVQAAKEIVKGNVMVGGSFVEGPVEDNRKGIGYYVSMAYLSLIVLSIILVSFLIRRKKKLHLNNIYS